ncbi:hypothetical protein FRC04_002770 [Tulasnella sp. 424]|nr:hypothetical protein FRC04_002770 [Tulasnella sp. 424]
MLFRAQLLVAAAALFAHQAYAKTCSAGYYIDSNLSCQKCPAGSYNSREFRFLNPPDLVHPLSRWSGKQQRPVHVHELQQWEVLDWRNCGTCTACPKGTFNNVVGAKSCCDCCAGWYSDSTGSTSCDQCPSSRKYSAVRSDNNNDCKTTRSQGIFQPQLPDYTTSCGMVADNVCPNTTGSGPQGTAISRKRRDVQCTKGFEACPRFSGRGGFDCVDTENDPEACGGCPSDDGQGSGTDCTAIKGVSVTRCVKRSCVIDSCRKGWVKSLDGTSCVSASHPTGSSDGIHVQDTDAKKKRSSAKRAIRANIY